MTISSFFFLKFAQTNPFLVKFLSWERDTRQKRERETNKKCPFCDTEQVRNQGNKIIVIPKEKQELVMRLWWFWLIHLQLAFHSEAHRTKLWPSFSGNKYRIKEEKEQQKFSYYAFFSRDNTKIRFYNVHTHTSEPQSVWKLREFYFVFCFASHSKLEENIRLAVGEKREGNEREQTKRKSPCIVKTRQKSNLPQCLPINC